MADESIRVPIDGDTSGFDQKVEGMKGTISAASVAMGNLLSDMGKKALSAFGDMISSGDEFNKAINQMSSSTGATGAELEGLRDVVKDVYGNNFGMEACGADYVFAPSVEEMYPVEDKRQFDFPPVTTVMEGAHRPGHFNGVCQVVSRLFYIVRPDRAYFGEKDWQQIAVVKAMVRFLKLNVQIVECTTIREADGLAKSSRNTLLSADERAIAPRIYEALKASREYAKTHTLAETHEYVVSTINAVDGLEVEYFSIVDGDTLLDVANWDDSAYVVGCITVYCGTTPIRLIDHITYKK